MDEYTRVAILENDMEAQLLEAVLEDKGIPFRMRSYHDTAFDGLFQVQKGWGYVSSPEEFHHQIELILADVRGEAIVLDD